MIETRPVDTFRHEALLYVGDDDFCARAEAFLHEGVAAGDPCFAVVDRHKVELLSSALGEHAARVHFVDIRELGRNPSRVLDAWREFVAQFPDARVVRGLSEPLGNRVTSVEREECYVYETLMNVALADAHLWLMCAFDRTRLDAADLERARRSHPLVRDDGDLHPSEMLADAASVLAGAFPEPLDVETDFVFTVDDLHDVRSVVEMRASGFGLAAGRVADFVLAASEIATNSVLHGGGHGRLRSWIDDAGLVCELTDAGHVGAPLALQLRPEGGQPGGYGLWIAQQLCDLVQIRSGAHGTTVRLRMLR